jgi:hypothetical protein
MQYFHLPDDTMLENLANTLGITTPKVNIPQVSDIIAFWGYPEPGVIQEHKELYPDALWVDLDVDFGHKHVKILPEAYCKIMKNIFDNAFKLKRRIIKILAPVGKDKCDAAFFAAQILKDEGFDVVTTIFEDISNPQPTPICTSDLPLKTKFELITGAIAGDALPDTVQSKARFGFWGVPPNDMSILELFPNNTHAFGWIRCVEAKVPASLELEMFVEPDLPTVFFAQTFCAKNQLAKYLAQKYNGLYLDIDGYANNSTRAKLEAFLRLR